MNELEIRKIIRDELEKNSYSGSPTVPRHTHDGVNSPQLHLTNIIGTSPVPFGTTKISTLGFSGDYGYASPNKLGAKQFFSNNYKAIAGQLIPVQNVLTTTPIPIIVGAVGQTFQGGVGDIGTLVGFETINLATKQLWVLMADGWHYVNLT